MMETEAEKAAEPLSSLRPVIFTIGRDSRGNWVAQEKSGACGGLFTNCAGALKFVKFESGSRAHTVVWANGALELNTSATLIEPSEDRLAYSPQRAYRAA